MPLTAVKILGASDQRSNEEKMKEAMTKTIAYGKLMNQETEYPKWNYWQLARKVLKSNPDFVLDEFNRREFDLMCLYFSGDPRFEQDGRSFQKGLAVYGPVGCGKSTMMRMFQVNTYRPFGVIPCRKISDLYSTGGIDVLNHHANLQTVYPKQHMGFAQLGRCFDDLGKEDTRTNFGNHANVMLDIIDKIYEYNRGGNFHMITNITGKQIEAFYGVWIKSRMRSLFNLIQFNKNSPDRRK